MMRGRVLVVDPDASERAAIAAQLDALGFVASVAADAAAARRELETASPDVALVDSEMLTALRIPVNVTLVAIVSDRAGEIGEAAARGAAEVIARPVVADELALRLQVAVQLRDATRVDHLTGLASHSHLDEHLAMAASSARRHSQPLALLLIGVDHLRRVNDEVGHTAGDEVLRAVGHRIAAAVRGEDITGRWGGDQLLVVAPATDMDGAWRLGERVREAVTDRPIPLSGGQDIVVTVSVGAAIGDGDHVDDQLRRVERVLYEAKAAGRNRVMTDAGLVS